MKICRFNGGRLGLVVGDEVVDVTPVLELIPAQHYPLPSHDLQVASLPGLRSAIEAHAIQGARYRVSDVKFEPPVATPGKIIGAPRPVIGDVQDVARQNGRVGGLAIDDLP